MFARLRPQIARHQRRAYASRKLPKSKSAPTSSPPKPEAAPITPEPTAQPRKDFRSPWFFRAVGIANFVIIPVVGIYAAFFWDWGNDEREHVMKPARRWLQRQKDAFFNLSPPEQELATPGGQVVPRPDSVEPPSASGLSTAGLPKGFFKPFFLVKKVDPNGPAAIAVLFHTGFPWSHFE
ncbi:hypothetical protein B0H16DRAFT_1492393 [Mycena metata]|uniref:Uncharacterized protein n=1 Tax=Mycena metata TaxID=1033252 RepID=A0AAD7KJD4_9AGAR|nr:hypothetical protein B0H16DRAFT_1492393 [Mycena metata]